MEVPEIGQYVLIRRRPAIVRNKFQFSDERTGYQYHMLDVDYIDGQQNPSDDQILWEREINAKSFEPIDFPNIEDFELKPDNPDRFNAFIDAIKWSSNGFYSLEDNKLNMTTSPLLSPWFSAVQIEDYQLYPVLESMSLPRVNLLLADDVGLGKTIEAGLIVQELIRQRRIRRIMVVCPSSLQIQWQDEMREKFNLEFKILDSAEVLATQRELGMDANPWMVYPKIITSMDYLKQNDVLQRFLVGTQHLLPGDSAMLPWDLLIVDEAHNFSPSRLSDESNRCSMLRKISNYFEHRLFLTATPHNGYTLSFSGLLELLDPIRFEQKTSLDENDFKHLEVAMVRRMKSELNEDMDVPRFPERHVDGIPIELTKKETELYDEMRHYRESANIQLGKIGKREKALGGFIFSLLTKRLLSSSYSFAKTWWNHIVGFDLEGLDYNVANESRVRAETPVTDDDEKVMRENDAIRHGAGWLSQYSDILSPYVEKVSKKLIALGWTQEVISKDITKIKKMPPDKKWEELMIWIKKNLMDGKHFKNNERLILFTEYKDTLDYLLKRFKDENISEPQIQILYGGADAKRRRNVKEEFNDGLSQLRILLATDAASEGLNLQTSCRYVIHQEIPWNPMRMEQRNGRVDRHGQDRDVFVHHFVSDQVADLKFLDFVAKKVDNVREDLGSVGNVLDEAIQEYFQTGKDISKQIEGRIEKSKKYAQDSKDLKNGNHGSKEDYDRTLERFKHTEKAMGFCEKSLIRMLSESCKLEGGMLMEVDPHIYRFKKIPPKWERIIKNSIFITSDYIRGAQPKLVFSPKRIEEDSMGRKMFKPRKDTKLLMLGHPLMNRAMSSLTRKLWESSDISKVNRWTVIKNTFQDGIDTIFLFNFQISMRNELGERFKTGLFQLPVAFKGEKLTIGDNNNFSEGESLSKEEISDNIKEIRSQWFDAKTFAEKEREKLISRLEEDTVKMLKKELTKEIKNQTEMFEHRKRSLEKQKNPKYMVKLRKELLASEERALQMTFSEEENRKRRQKVADLKIKMDDADWQRRQSHINELKEKLEKEKTRIIERVLPKRYTLMEDGIDIQAVGVKVILNNKGGS